MFEAISRVGNVFFGPVFQVRPLLKGKGTSDFGRCSEDKGAGRNSGVLRDQRLGANQTLRADFRAVQHYRAHADEAFVSYGAGVDDGGMPDGDVTADEAWELVRQVQHRIVLDIAPLTHDDAVNVAAQDGIVPDAGTIAESDVAHDDRAAGNINVLAQEGLLAQKRAELIGERIKRFHIPQE